MSTKSVRLSPKVVVWLVRITKKKKNQKQPTLTVPCWREGSLWSTLCPQASQSDRARDETSALTSKKRRSPGDGERESRKDKSGVQLRSASHSPCKTASDRSMNISSPVFPPFFFKFFFFAGVEKKRSWTTWRPCDTERELPMVAHWHLKWN